MHHKKTKSGIVSSISENIKKIRLSTQTTPAKSSGFKKQSNKVQKAKPSIQSGKGPVAKKELKNKLSAVGNATKARLSALDNDNDEGDSANEEDDDDDESDILEGFDDDDDEDSDEADSLLDDQAEVGDSESDSADEDEDASLQIASQGGSLSNVTSLRSKRPRQDDSSDEDDDSADDRPALKSPAVPPNRKRKLSGAESDDAEPVKAPSKKPNVAKQLSPHPSGDRKEFLEATPDVADPIVRKEIKAIIENRLRSTVRLRPLPASYRFNQLYELCPEATAVRIPWNMGKNRTKGVAFLEFKDPSTAQKWSDSLQGKKLLATKVNCSIMNEAHVDINEYNCCRLVVSSLHPHTTKQEFKDLLPNVKAVDFLPGTRSHISKAPAFVFLTFHTEQEAMNAIDSFQGTTIRNRKSSWMFQKKAEKLAEKIDRTELVVFGVSKKISDADLQKAFPHSKKIEIRSNSGMAVISYNCEDDCKVDYQNCPGTIKKIGNTALKVFYGHQKHKPKADRVALAEKRKAEASAAPKPIHPTPKRAQLKPSMQKVGKQNSTPMKKPEHQQQNLSKTQLVIKKFGNSVSESDFTNFVGVPCKRFLFTKDKGLAFMHFESEKDAAAAKLKFESSKFQGSKVLVQFAFDKPGKKKGLGSDSAEKGKGMFEKTASAKKDFSAKKKFPPKAPLAANETLGGDSDD